MSIAVFVAGAGSALTFVNTRTGPESHHANGLPAGPPGPERCGRP
jgi:hypothetical protein